MSALQNYYEINGFSQAQVDAVNTNALLAQAVLDASRFKALESKNKATLKQVRKAPPVTKPKAQTNTQKTDEIAKLEAAARKGGVAGGRAYVKLQNMKKG